MTPKYITEKELKIACKQLNLKIGIFELIINKIRENQNDTENQNN